MWKGVMDKRQTATGIEWCRSISGLNEPPIFFQCFWNGQMASSVVPPSLSSSPLIRECESLFLGQNSRLLYQLAVSHPWRVNSKVMVCQWFSGFLCRYYRDASTNPPLIVSPISMYVVIIMVLGLSSFLSASSTRGSTSLYFLVLVIL